jgi:DNA-3-methyladenine glycosylase II
MTGSPEGEATAGAPVLAHLAAADPVLGRLIRAAGPYRLERQSDCEPFQILAQAIAHQQLNGTAANTILARLVDSCGAGVFPTPAQVLAAPVAQLRAAGFSFAKVAALKDLSHKALASLVPDRATLAALADEQIVARLTQVRGIGRWTVEMLLIFHLGREDVLPVDDFGVRSGFRAAYGLRRLPHPRALAAFGERWRPYRTAAAWYLWRALELERAGALPKPAQRVRLPRAVKRRAVKRRARRTVKGRTVKGRTVKRRKVLRRKPHRELRHGARRGAVRKPRHPPRPRP